MTTSIASITNNFEGSPLTTLTYKGRPAWIAREVGAAIGYSHGGKRFATKITGAWASEFIADQDFAIIKGDELVAAKQVLEPGTDSVPGRTSALLLLFETGLQLALIKTNKPIGQRLRRFVATEVMPQIARDGAYLPERKVENGQIVANPDYRLLRERRLGQKLEFENRKFVVQTIDHAVTEMKETLSADAIQSLRLRTVEIATGQDYSNLKPNIGDGWIAPAVIGKRLGVSANRVGRSISKLNLRGDIPGMARPILNTVKNGSRNVTSYLYSPAAVQKITDHLEGGGHLPPNRALAA